MAKKITVEFERVPGPDYKEVGKATLVIEGNPHDIEQEEQEIIERIKLALPSMQEFLVHDKSDDWQYTKVRIIREHE